MFLPAVERRGEICFHVLKGLPYSARLLLSFLLMISGFAIQLILQQPHAFGGIVVVFLGVLPLLTKGYQNIVTTTGDVENWRPVHRDEIQRILDVAKKQRTWDRDMFDITSWQGKLTMFLLVLALVAIASQLLLSSEPLAVMLCGNAAAIFLPFWFTGARRILKNDRLVVKCNILIELAEALGAEARDGEEFQFQMQTKHAVEQDADIPCDVKGLVAFHNAPEGFLGIQVQVSINSIQGTDYPYCYCVIVTTPEFSAKRGLELSPPPGNIVTEPEYNQGVNIIVIRQETTRTSGYHTKPAAARAIFAYAVAQARQIIS